MNQQMTTHDEELVRLRRIEGQIRGIQKMIEEKRYCIDILTQISSIVGALKSVEENILKAAVEETPHCSHPQTSPTER